MRKVAIITGASSGIGEAAAVRLAKDGWHVSLAARRVDRLEALTEKLAASGSQAIAMRCDVACREDVQALIDHTVDTWGTVDALVNNAGIMPLAPMEMTRVDDWDAMIDVNIKGVLYGIAAVLPVMLERGNGHIFNVSSVAGRRVFPNGTVYSATKHAVHALSEGLRSELAQKARDDGNRIRVTVLAPGVVRTELPDSITHEETRTAAKASYGALPDPLVSDDMAEAVAWALSAPDHVDINEILVRPTTQIG